MSIPPLLCDEITPLITNKHFAFADLFFAGLFLMVGFARLVLLVCFCWFVFAVLVWFCFLQNSESSRGGEGEGGEINILLLTSLVNKLDSKNNPKPSCWPDFPV